MLSSKTDKSKVFDCVAAKRLAQARTYRDIQNLSASEQIAYFDHKVRHGPLAEFWRRLEAGHRQTSMSGKIK